VSEAVLKSRVTAQTALKKAQITRQTALTKEATRHQETLQRLQIQHQGAETAAQRAQIAQATLAERARHNRWVEQHPRATATKRPPAPHRVAPGVWRTADGTPLNPAGSAFWEKKFKQGFTDGRGKLLGGPGAPGATSGFNWGAPAPTGRKKTPQQAFGGR
jgi:hypothetical protein